MEVRSGYKQTELGIIPEDWDVLAVGQLLRRTPSYGINAPAIPFDSRFPTYLRITDITDDGRFAEASKASVDHLAAGSYALEVGDVVFARTGASVGKSYLYRLSDGRLVFAGFLIRLSPDPQKLVPAFLSHYVQTRHYWKWVKANSMRSGQPGINGREYASLPIPLPPTKAEQEAIAEALGDADALIESLERLLAKKRQLKQGVMQELLTGKRRLPGFEVKPGYKQTEVGVIPEDWKEMPFVQAVGSYIDYRGRTPRKLGMSWGGGQILALSANNVQMGRIDPEKDAYFGSEDLYKRWMTQGDCELGDILLTMEAPLGNVAQIPDSKRYILSQRVLLIKPKTWLLRNFFAHYLKSDSFQRELTLNATGSTAKGIQRKKLDQLVIALPTTKAEQEAIAGILSDMDGEIGELEAKLSKARAIKQGMMQELLTGRIRLV